MRFDLDRQYAEVQTILLDNFCKSRTAVTTVHVLQTPKLAAQVEEWAPDFVRDFIHKKAVLKLSALLLLKILNRDRYRTGVRTRAHLLL